MLEHLQRMFAYDRWATARMRAAFDGLAESGALDSEAGAVLAEDRAASQSAGQRILGLYAHMYGSRRMWMGRIEGTADAAINTWPALSLADCDAWRAELDAKWEGYLAALDEDGLRTLVTYTTQAGQAGQQTVGDILTHAVLHSMHHRGQLSMLIREAGGAPLGQDFVVFTKETLYS